MSRTGVDSAAVLALPTAWRQALDRDDRQRVKFAATGGPTCVSIVARPVIPKTVDPQTPPGDVDIQARRPGRGDSKTTTAAAGRGAVRALARCPESGRYGFGVPIATVLAETPAAGSDC